MARPAVTVGTGQARHNDRLRHNGTLVCAGERQALQREVKIGGVNPTEAPVVGSSIIPKPTRVHRKQHRFVETPWTFWALRFHMDPI